MDPAANATPAHIPVRLLREGREHDAPVATRSAPRDPLPLVRRLSEALVDEGVRYCQWKSTESLDLAAAGAKDLDLLVAREDADRFRRVLEGLGFKIAAANAKRSVPG